MKSFQTKTAVAILIAAGSIVPAFARDHDGERGNDRGSQGGGGAYRGGEMRQQQSRPEARPQAPQMRENFRGGGEQFRAPQQQFRGNEQYRAPQQQQFRGNDFRGNEQFRGAPQQQFRGNDFRPQNNFRGGNSFGFGGRSWENDHRNWSERGGYRGYVIPRNRFYVNFGRDHFFRIGRPVFYDDYASFWYGGYSFSLLDPWPTYWGADWYDTDDVYVDYVNDGYYLYNRRYPGVGLALDITF